MLVPNRMERAMATMNVSLPDQMKEWVEAQAESGRYANASDYVRDLIRRDQEKAEKIAHWTRLVEEARASGVSERTPEQLFNDIVSGALRR
jgi:antitoxin ParD1/3/4